MPQVIYGDVYFLVNFSIDFLVLTLCGYFLRERRRFFRILFASACGGLYALLMLLPSLIWWQVLLVQIFMSGVLCLIAYGRMPVRAFLRIVLAFYAASFMLGGALNALYSMLSAALGTVFDGGSGAVVSEQKAEIFMLFALVSAGVLAAAGRIFSRHGRLTHVVLEIEEDGRRVCMKGMVDSGNLLQDPLSGKAVIVARAKQVSPILPSGAFDFLRHGSGDGIPLHKRRKMRVIVARGIDGGCALLGYQPDCILVASDENEKHKRAVDAILAVYEGDTQDFAGYAAIVPASLVD